MIIISLFFYNFAFGQTYKPVYSCGFEDGEDISNWNIEVYSNPEYPCNGDNYYDYFYINTLENAYYGEKALYISDNAGVTNTISLTTKLMYSMADLQVNLSEGNYILSFAYKNPPPQTFNFIITSELCNASADFSLFLQPITNSLLDWDVMNVSFTIPEGKQANHIAFCYIVGNGSETVEGGAIDNVVIKKDFGPSYNISGSVINEGEAVSSGIVSLYEVHTLSQYTLVETVSIASDGSYIFTEIIPNAYIIKAVTTDLGNTVPTYYGNSENWQDAGVIALTNNSVNNRNIAMVNALEPAGMSNIGGYVEEEVEGRVIKRPAENVDVRLEKQENNVWITVSQIFTNAEGCFEFNEIEHGKHRVIIDIPGLPMIDTHVLEVDDIDIEDIKYIVTKEGIKNGNVGINDIGKNGNLIVFPNPTNGKLQVTGYELQVSVLQIFDVLGRLVYSSTCSPVHSSTCSPVHSSTKIDISFLEAGVYFLRVGGENLKVIKN